MNDGELVRAVATEVMGWEIVPSMKPLTFCDQWGRYHTVELTSYPQFNPLTDANHMMLVVEVMVDSGHEVQITMPVGPKYQSEACVDSFSARHNNPGHAVCLAALEAVRGEKR